jgi:alginate O-acetyltransferase complex protein AlgI
MFKDPLLLIYLTAFALLFYWLCPRHWHYARALIVALASFAFGFLLFPLAALMAVLMTFLVYGLSFLISRFPKLYVLFFTIAMVVIPISFFRLVPVEGKVIQIIGLGFVTVKSIHMIVETYRLKTPQNLLNMLVLNLFYPIFSAGPVEELKTFSLSEFGKTFKIEYLSDGFLRFALGVFKSGFVASLILLPFMQNAWSGIAQDPAAFSQIEVYQYTLLRYLYVYISFSAYSDMAIGIGLMYGFKIQENFNFPLLSTSIQNYWKRWHISMGNWVSKYLFFPMVLHFRGNWVVPIAFILSFVALGFWHGYTGPWISWGFLHGIALAGTYFGARHIGKTDAGRQILTSVPGKLAGWFLTINYVAFVQTFANQHDFSQSLVYTKTLLGL